MRMTSFIIGLLLVGLVATSMTYSLARLTTEYSTSYDNSTFSGFDRINDLNETVRDVEASTEQSNSSTSTFIDLLGDFVSKAVFTAKVTKESYTVYSEMAETTEEKLGLPAFVMPVFGIIIVLLIAFFIVALMLRMRADDL